MANASGFEAWGGGEIRPSGVWVGPKLVNVDASALVGAVAAGREYGRLWRARDERWGEDTWQAISLECLRLPGVWDALCMKLARERRVVRYTMPEKVTLGDDEHTERWWGVSGVEKVRGLPGWSLSGQGMAWCRMGSASTCWDGMRREVDGTLGYELMTIATGLADGDERGRARAKEIVDGYGVWVSAITWVEERTVIRRPVMQDGRVVWVTP